MKGILDRIVDYQILRSGYVSDIGLFHGKMGIAVALYLYGYKLRDSLIMDYGWELLQKVYDGVNDNMQVGLADGLAGIGYGTTMLRTYGVMDCNLNEVLADIDAKIIEFDVRRISDMSVRTGLGGLLAYLTFRQSQGEPIVSLDRLYLDEIRRVAPLSVVGQKCFLELLNPPLFPISDYLDNPLPIDAGSAFHILRYALT